MKKLLVVSNAVGFLEGSFKDYCDKQNVDLTILNFKKGRANESLFTVNYVLKNNFDGVIAFQLYRNLKTKHIKTLRGLRKIGIPVFDNGLCKNEYVINKVEDLKKLKNCNITIPKYIEVKEPKDLYDFSKLLGFPIIAKITNMSQGRGVYKLNNTKEISDFINTLKDKKKDLSTVIAQQFVDYKVDLRVLLIGKYTYTMQRIPKKGEFRANHSLGGSVKPYKPSDKVLKLAKESAKCVDLVVSGVDILIDKNDNPICLEVNHNPGFAGMQKAHKVSLAKPFFKTVISNLN